MRLNSMYQILIHTVSHKTCDKENNYLFSTILTRIDFQTMVT